MSHATTLPSPSFLGLGLGLGLAGADWLRGSAPPGLLLEMPWKCIQNMMSPNLQASASAMRTDAAES